MKEFTEKDAEETLQKGYKKAEKILNDENKKTEFIKRLDNILKTIPIAGETMSMVPTMISLVKSYLKKEYKDVPIKSILAVLSALLYLIAPIDVIPDALPGIGLVDDTLVIGSFPKYFLTMAIVRDTKLPYVLAKS